MNKNSERPVVLVIAGNDPSGGAGIAADIQAISALGAHPAPVVTCLTVQDTCNAYEVECCDAAFVYRQASRILEDLPVAAVKIGLLGNAEIANTVAQLLKASDTVPIVLDPVLVAAGGARLATLDLKHAIINMFCPLATVITPNASEIRELAGPVDGDGDLQQARAKKLFDFGCEYVLAKGADEPDPDPGQQSLDKVTNTLYRRDGSVHVNTWPRLPHSYHGSGCTLASALAALLAQGVDMVEADSQAQDYTYAALSRGFKPGAGQHIPLRHWR